MLILKNITKTYESEDFSVQALKGVSLAFRKNEFVAVLGQSGCGKTTMLNIVGGLDRYTSGDLVIGGVSTKHFHDRDWDNYRNHTVGFVFQSYNLIPHQTVLGNVELALTLSGISVKERRQRATEALCKVGLKDQINKRPNQLSGGQMQRVAIARALVNNPAVILADEPTGALDSETSVQVMDLLKEVAEDRLVIMVTHNPELAQEYATRIITLSDGLVTGDSNPYTEEAALLEEQLQPSLFKEELAAQPSQTKPTEPNAQTQPAEPNVQAQKQSKPRKVKKQKKASMSFFTALSLSLRNLTTKKARTILTSFAGSIGIIGIALILSLSNGIQNYIDRVQEDTLSTYPISLNAS
ncbi:MAG: ABC transporter ATP-binding protein, partial [Clostridia bacterium]|nr:ABC transporter ATP-binding protein [Clostridia bacterium]